METVQVLACLTHILAYFTTDFSLYIVAVVRIMSVLLSETENHEEEITVLIKAFEG
jgi:hypothetical protein